MNQQPDEQPGQSNRQHQDSDAVSDKDALARDDNPSAHNDGKLSKRRAHDDASRIAGETDSPVGAVEGKTATEQERDEHERRAATTGKSAFLVGAGILISRIVGLVRQRVFAYYFGTSDAADAFNAAFRIPNFLQNVFGEGALSASFIPVYAGLLARGANRIRPSPRPISVGSSYRLGVCSRKRIAVWRATSYRLQTNQAAAPCARHSLRERVEGRA